MHYKEAKSILSPHNGMNLYRGCSHGCIYCDSRSECYNFQHDFEDIEIKSNAIELLEDALKRKRTKCMIGTGSMTDPYIPLEKELCNVRRSLELADRYGFGFSLITKSDLVLRDIDLLRSINERTKAVVQMTLTTYDEELCRILEPNVCTTKRRFEVLKELHEAGIPTVVWFCPILPFINDTEENISGILRYCADAHVKGVMFWGAGMTLRKGDREYFYNKLDEHFPGLKDRYIRTYGDAYNIMSPKNPELSRLFHRICEAEGLMHDNDTLFGYMNAFEEKQRCKQTTLF